MYRIVSYLVRITSNSEQTLSDWLRKSLQ